MILKDRQDNFDVEKWYDSIRDGEDKCGSYDFCKSCRGEYKYPCAKAMNRYKKGYVVLATLHASKK